MLTILEKVNQRLYILAQADSDCLSHRTICRKQNVFYPLLLTLTNTRVDRVYEWSTIGYILAVQ